MATEENNEASTPVIAVANPDPETAQVDPL
jgi:hypothetical protein